MTFRTRILLACLLVAMAPLALFALGAQRAVRERLTGQFAAQVSESSDVIRQDLARQATLLNQRLRTLAQNLADDAGQRAALLQGVDRARILDYATNVMPGTGLEYLLLLDSAGSVLSSGHYRNDYDRRFAGLPALLDASDLSLITARRPERTFLALVRAWSFDISDRRFTLVGGLEVDTTFVRNLARDAAHNVVVSLEYPDGALFSDGRTDEAMNLRAFSEPLALLMPFLDDVSGTGRTGEAQWTIRHALAPLQAVQRTMDMWFVAALAAAFLFALLMARLLAARVNQPLEELADKTTRINLDRLDVTFATERADEIGSLARLLDSMVKRLRSSAQQLRTAERRATVGDLARQVNHDIRNGLLPIRNVIQHLTEVAQDSPEQLGTVFRERESTLQGSIGYLENLAGNYARLSPRTQQQVCDVNAVVRAVVGAAAFSNDARVQLALSETTPRVAADPVALRRVVENLAINALESLPNGTGQVTLATSLTGHGADRRVQIRVSDTGAGIEPAVLDRIFDDFFTTRERGTGLGLSIVRRLVADMSGRIRVSSEPGRGSIFLIELPAL